MKNLGYLILFAATGGLLSAATLYTPSGGLSSSTTSNIGIGTNAPGTFFSVHGAIGVGTDEIPVVESNFGYSTGYKVLRLGLDQANRSLALNVDPLSVTGGQFTGNGQILIGNKAVLAPNAAGTDWMGVLRAANGKVYVGGSLSSGEMIGDGLVIDGSKVGIGTSNPSAKLEIAVPSGGADGIQITRPSSPTWQLMNYGPFYIQEAGVGPRLVVASGGNVGINTASPQARLHVFAGSIFNQTGSGVADYIFGNADGGTNGKYSYIGGASGGYILFGKLNDDLVTKTEYMRINGGNGNVGIGTTTPSHKLAVNGTIRAKEVIVDTGWADYVFADDYRLAPLTEVEAHIRDKKHLPGIPSAAEVEAGGVSLGDMQSKLLAKVEELTLHAITQNKRLDEQAARIAVLEQENRTLRSR